MSAPQHAQSGTSEIIAFAHRDQDQLARDMRKSAKATKTASKEDKGGRPTTFWSDIKHLFERWDELTAGDVASMTGRDKRSAQAFLRSMVEAGKLKSRVIPGSSGMRAWWLA